MKKLLSFACAIAVGVALSSTSYADVTGAGGGGTFTDLTLSSSSIVIGASETITDVELTLFGLDHTWAGDLQATLTHFETGTVISLFDGIGAVGNVGAGDSSDFGGDYTISNDGGDIWAAAAAVGGADPIPPGDYFAGDIDNNFVDMAAAFAGENTQGTWTLDIFDRAGGDTGDWDSWELRLTSFAGPAVPEPGSLALIGMMGVACVIRRRR